MTEEERMICEMELVWSNIGPSYKWMPVEPAPMKDWRPVCFSHCKGKVYLTTDGKECEECKNCPYRKME